MLEGDAGVWAEEHTLRYLRTVRYTRAAGEAGEEGFLRVVCGDVNFGVHGRDFAVLFSRT